MDQMQLKGDETESEYKNIDIIGNIEDVAKNKERILIMLQIKMRKL